MYEYEFIEVSHCDTQVEGGGVGEISLAESTATGRVELGGCVCVWGGARIIS